MRLALLVLACCSACSEGEGPTPAADDAGRDAAAEGAVDAGPLRREPDPDGLVAIPSSTFSMGHPVEAPGPYGQPWKENELPAHDVTLPEYLLDRDEVTVAVYAEFLRAAGGSVHWHPRMPIRAEGGRFEPDPDATHRPIAFVSWYDAATYCAWSSGRLPTEAEWERAARGPDGATFPWGEAWPSCRQAVFSTGASSCEEAPAVVGSRPEGDSAEGFRDLAGNVAEWVSDVYGRYASDAQQSPRGPAAGRYRVVRGGGFHEPAASLRGSARWPAEPAGRSVEVGFRCAYDSH